MPIFDYQCLACSHVSEVFQTASSNSSELSCEACGKTKLERLVSSPTFQLKGSGWYETDFRGKTAGESSASSSSESSS